MFYSTGLGLGLGLGLICGHREIMNTTAPAVAKTRACFLLNDNGMKAGDLAGG